MDISKIGASFLSQTAEANFGLATLNLDFSIMKFEAPKEYEPLSGELSTARRKAAEDEQPHFTARKLGALFQDWIPHTPNLTRAFGRRAVEIARNRDANPKATRADGIFSEHVGIDGTGIWAAATSGPHVIPIFLLACILSRMWSPSEATAIWDQLVIERQRELSAVEDVHPMYEKSAYLSRLSIVRDDLARWDASARAWVQAADHAMAKKHKQLMLIVDNIELPVNNKPKLFENVKETWKSAMEVVDKLIKGAPQSIRNGAVLLGLSSWHIFPDLIVLGSGSGVKEVRQHDPLVDSAGILTVGLHIENPRNQGVYWSLPLSHLRYYGGPVMAERSLAVHGNRITVPELIQVSMGCLTRKWKMNKKALANCLLRLWDYIEAEAVSHTEPGCPYWFSYLSRALEPLIGGDDAAEAQCQRLIAYGERRCPDFLLPPKLPVQPLFGMLNLHTYLNLLGRNEDGIHALRSIAEELAPTMESSFLIRYSIGSGNAQKYSFQYEYATALPIAWASLKRDADGNPVPTVAHARWVNTIFTDAKGNSVYDGSRLEHFRNQGEIAFAMETVSMERKENSKGFIWHSPPREFRTNREEDFEIDVGYDMDVESVTTCFGEEWVPDIEFDFVAGDSSSIGLFATSRFHKSETRPVPSRVPMQTLVDSLEKGTLGNTKIVKFLDSVARRQNTEELLSSFKALATVESIYRMLPGSTIALEVTAKPLYTMDWVPASRSKHFFRPELDRENISRPPPRKDDVETEFRFSPFKLDIGSTFALIALFESGSLAIRPSSLQSIMALATGDSIYIAGGLLCDPSEICNPTEIRRVRGSIGRPGMAMLIPPPEPQIREADTDWRLVSHSPFDGRLEDSFSKTSLHLHFTDYVLPIDVGTHGNKDIEVYFLESVVSVFDDGKWVGDLDILTQLASPLLYRLDVTCNHGKGNTETEQLLDNPDFTMTDNWDEILEDHDSATIVRSTDNHVGRLATTAMALQLEKTTVILPNRCCWACIKQVWVEGKDPFFEYLNRSDSGTDSSSNAETEESDMKGIDQVLLENEGEELEEVTPMVPESDRPDGVAEGHWDLETGDWVFDAQPDFQQTDDITKEVSGLDDCESFLAKMRGVTFIC